ncbi:arginine deiminase [Pontibacillus yanchengensis]|uniref:Arginine deiminase n=2 Tax=Pontibacillus yanchengensis TaxID=462910 RepID=A0A6I5A5E8_9BACI|nr:arginine deiminase family protein [Pontibacillus yanchengensis]MYL35595.1 arginine deiminase [Pontibacillus yanchengensis]MYL53655.1 arginine deiminase [Pontibacillus yanchengensis]
MNQISPNCFSEHEQLKSVVLCPPSSLDVPDQKTATMVQWNGPVNQEIAHENHENLTGALSQEGVHVIQYEDELSSEGYRLSDQLINRMFVRDLACVFGNTILPGEAGTSMRKPEYIHLHSLMNKWFPHHFQIHENNDVSSLEFGDVLVLNKDAIFINVGMRTSISSVERVKNSLFEAGFSEIGIIDLPRSASTLHLDMNCNVVGSNVVISKSFLRYFPIQVLTQSTVHYSMMQEFMSRHGFDVYWIESYKTIPDINFLNINPETILISKQANLEIFRDHPVLKKKKYLSIDVTELEKGGGGIRCMTLPLERRL